MLLTSHMWPDSQLATSIVSVGIWPKNVVPSRHFGTRKSIFKLHMNLHQISQILFVWPKFTSSGFLSHCSRKGSSVLVERRVCSLESDYESVDWTMELHGYAWPASFSRVASGPKVLCMDSESLSTNV